MAAVKIDSQSRKVRKYVAAILVRDKAKLALAAAEAQATMLLADLTGGQLGEARRVLETMRGETG